MNRRETKVNFIDTEHLPASYSNDNILTYEIPPYQRGLFCARLSISVYLSPVLIETSKMSQNVYLSIPYTCLKRCYAVPNCPFLCILLISWRLLHCPWLSTNSSFLFTKHTLHCFRLLVFLYSRWFNFLSGCGESIIPFGLLRKINSFWFLEWSRL